MELSRRQFARLLASAAAMTAARFIHVGKPASLRRTVRALRGRLFPGRLRSLSAKKVSGPAKWLG